MNGARPDPDQIHTPEQWLKALHAVKGGLSHTALNHAANPEDRPGEGLPKSTLSNLLNKGQPTVETLEGRLFELGVPESRLSEPGVSREGRLFELGVPGEGRSAKVCLRGVAVVEIEVNEGRAT